MKLDWEEIDFWLEAAEHLEAKTQED